MNQIISTHLKQANPKYQLHTCKLSECLNLFAMSMELDLLKLGIELAKPPCDGPKRPLFAVATHVVAALYTAQIGTALTVATLSCS